MINTFLITGDCHGEFSRFKNLPVNIQKDRETAIIILGDAGFNYFLDERDSHIKNKLTTKYNFTIYCIRGNHEARPESIPSMRLMFDTDVNGYVYNDPKWPRIKYFKNWGTYWINGYNVGVIGGAYSVDKYYRLNRGLKWFKDEQLSAEERDKCFHYFKNFKEKKFDFILTHTSPISWEPSDLFLPMVDQTTVDKTMEEFLEQIKETVNWKTWCFGHYHADRIERPYVEQLYKDIENIEDIAKRWRSYRKTNELDWWLHKSPNFYMEEN